MRTKNSSWDRLQGDLDNLGLRRRRVHVLRRTMISLAQDDGAVISVLKWATHDTRRREAVDGYTTLEWETLCREVAKLKIHLPGRFLEGPMYQIGSCDSGSLGRGFGTVLVQC